MAEGEDIGQLKAKIEELEAQAAEFESYKEECKQFQEMLEEESLKKETEIKQLKEQAIKREKGQKMLKAQLSQIQAENANLKMKLNDAPKIDSQAEGLTEQILQLQTQNANFKEANKQLEIKLQQASLKVTTLEGQLQEANANTDTLQKSLLEAQHKAKSIAPPLIIPSPCKDTSKTEQELKKLKEKLIQMQKEKLKAEKFLKEKEVELERLKYQWQQRLKKIPHIKTQEQKPLRREQSQPKELKDTVPLSEHRHQLSKLNQTIHQQQDRIKQLEAGDKEQKIKLTQIMNEKTALLQKYKKLSQDFERQRGRRDLSQSESPQKSQEIMIEDGLNQEVKETPSVRMDSVLLTKKHYLSPFIEVKEGRLIKLFKSTKNGFEKSLGATRHKFDSVGHDGEAVAQTASELAKATLDQGHSHSVVIYGSRHTNKKLILSAILQKMKDWLLEKVDQQQQSAEEEEGINIKLTYLKHSPDAEIHEEREATTREQITEILEELTVISGGSSSPKKIKKNQKPKVRYLKFAFGDGLRLQLITTSHLNPFLKQNQTFIDYLNTIVFSKLPNILQSTHQHYHIITLVNPIVSEYEECKNTLSITMVPLTDTVVNDEPMASTLVYTPTINREDLNELTKKKLQSFEKETEQAGIRVRRVEEECAYFRNRFEQLEIRLKNLINTHQQQNTYLKKSPVTLSYQKLLKFVNSVLSRNISLPRPPLSYNIGQGNEDHFQNQVNMYIEEDAKSLDGY